MNCIETREILKSGERPSERILEHLRECGECARVADREKGLSELLKMAPAVELPSDFDRSLMNKIENRRRGGSSVSFLRPGFLVPVSAAAVLLAVLAITFALFQGQTPPETADTADESIPVNSSADDGGPSTSGSETFPSSDELAGPVVNASPERAGTPRPNGESADQRKDDEERFEGRSRDLAAGTPESIIPPFFDGTPKAVPDPAPARRFSPGELLAEIGIEARFEQGGWKVLSVRQESIGARAGVRNGDLITSLDGRALTDAPIEGGGKNLLVVRGSRELTLTITP
ncbi:MAG TPA: hypothetical protein VMM38_06295 [Aridibacter sp.]|nr:hypothetical protein [Aridibacter sp.]